MHEKAGTFVVFALSSVMSAQLLVVLLHVQQDVQHLVVEARVQLVAHLVRHDTVEEVRLDRQHVRRVAAGALEVEAAELHALVDVHVRHQLDLRVLREMQRGIARPPLVLGQRENGVLGVASRVHEAGRRGFYSWNTQDSSIGRSIV